MIGEPVVFVLEQYAKVANWVAIGLVVVIFAGAYRNQSKKATAQQSGVGNSLSAGQ